LKALLLAFELMVGGAVGVGVSNLRRGRVCGRSITGTCSAGSPGRIPPVHTKDGGAGLGLALSAAIARAHGGTLELVDSSTTGSTFRLQLP